MKVYEIRTDHFEFRFGTSKESIFDMTAQELFDTYLEGPANDPTVVARFDSEAAAREAFHRDYANYGTTRAEKGNVFWLLVGDLAWIEENEIDEDGDYIYGGDVLWFSAEGYSKDPEALRDSMLESDENMGWCKPYWNEDRTVAVAVNRGELTGAMIDGRDVPSMEMHKPDFLEKLARRVNPYYDDYSGWGNLHIALDVMREGPCKECPWFHICAAMDEKVEG